MEHKDDLENNSLERNRQLNRISHYFAKIDVQKLVEIGHLLKSKPGDLNKLIIEGKDVLNKKLDTNLESDKIWDGAFGDVDGLKFLYLSDDEAKQLIAKYMKDEKDSWLKALDLVESQDNSNTSQIENNKINIVENIEDIAENTLENIVEKHLSFMRNINPKNDRKFIEKQADYLRLVKYTKQFFEKMIVPNKIQPLSDTNLSKEEIIYTYYKLYKAIAKKKKYPASLFLFINSVFSEISNSELTESTYRTHSIYKNFKREPLHYSTINPL